MDCEHDDQFVDEGLYICRDCFCIIDDLIFDTPIQGEDHRSRLKHYEKFLDNFSLDGVTKMCLIDSFSKVESCFYRVCKRKNFINLHQLTIELLNRQGSTECVSQFKNFKSANRCKIVGKIVQKCLECYFGDYVPETVFSKIANIELGSNQKFDGTKLIISDHCFTDRSNI